MKFLSSRLIQVRTGLGISKAEAARRLHMTAMSYGRYENGDRIPSYQTVCYMANVLGTSADYLYGTTEDPQPKEIIVSSEEDPDLFRLASLFRSIDAASRKRLLAYCIELTGMGS